jgi:hypothetical protein
MTNYKERWEAQRGRDCLVREHCSRGRRRAGWHACDQGKLCWRTTFRLSFMNVFCSDGESSPLCSSLWASDELSEWCAKTELAGARCSGTSMIVKTSNDRG